MQGGIQRLANAKLAGGGAKTKKHVR